MDWSSGEKSDNERRLRSVPGNAADWDYLLMVTGLKGDMEGRHMFMNALEQPETVKDKVTPEYYAMLLQFSAQWKEPVQQAMKQLDEAAFMASSITTGTAYDAKKPVALREQQHQQMLGTMLDKISAAQQTFHAARAFVLEHGPPTSKTEMEGVVNSFSSVVWVHLRGIKEDLTRGPGSPDNIQL